LSEIRATTISDETGNGPIALTKQSAAKGWCSMTGGTGTVSLQSNSLNTSSAVDFATAKYSFNWTNAMSDAHYPAMCCALDQSYTYSFATGGGEARTTSKVGTYWMHHSGSAYDVPDLEAVIHGDLA